MALFFLFPVLISQLYFSSWLLECMATQKLPTAFYAPLLSYSRPLSTYLLC